MTKKIETFNYAAKTTELEQIVAALQKPDIALNEAIVLHEKGTKLVSELEAYLTEAEVTIIHKTAEEV